MNSRRRPACMLALGAVVLLAALQLAGWPQPLSWSQAARSASLQSLAQGPSFAHPQDPARAAALVLGDDLHSAAGTRAQHAPLLALLAALPTRALMTLGFEPGSATMERALAFLIVGLPSALAAAALALSCAALGATPRAGALWALLAFTCTAWLPQALVLGQHGAAAAALIAGLAALHSARLLLAGALAGLAAGIDLPHAAALIAFGLAAWGLRGAPGALRFSCGALPPLALAAGLGLPARAQGAEPLAELPFALLPGPAWGEELPNSDHAYAALEIFGWDGLLAREPLALLGALAALLLAAQRLRTRGAAAHKTERAARQSVAHTVRFGVDAHSAARADPARAARVLVATAGASALAIALAHLIPCGAQGQAAHARAWMASVEPLLVLPLAAAGSRLRGSTARALFGAALVVALLAGGLHAALASRAPWSRLTLNARSSSPSAVPGQPPDTRWRARATHAWLRHVHAPDAASAARAPLELLAQHEAWLRSESATSSPAARELRVRRGLARLQAVLDGLEARSSAAPVRVHAHWRVGRLHELLGERALARRAFERALAIDAGFAPAQAALARLKDESRP